MKRLLLIIFTILACQLTEAQLAKFQALYIFNFARNTSWPQEDNGKEFTITVVGDNAVASALRAVVKSKKVGDRVVTINETSSASGLPKSDIVYLGESKASRIGQLVASQAGNKVLIISGASGQCSQGAGIAFAPDGGKLSFEINEANIAKHGLKVAPKVAQLGRQVN